MSHHCKKNAPRSQWRNRDLKLEPQQQQLLIGRRRPPPRPSLVKILELASNQNVMAVGPVPMNVGSLVARRLVSATNAMLRTGPEALAALLDLHTQKSAVVQISLLAATILNVCSSIQLPPSPPLLILLHMLRLRLQRPLQQQHLATIAWATEQAAKAVDQEGMNVGELVATRQDSAVPATRKRVIKELAA